MALSCSAFTGANLTVKTLGATKKSASLNETTKTLLYMKLTTFMEAPSSFLLTPSLKAPYQKRSGWRSRRNREDNADFFV